MSIEWLTVQSFQHSQDLLSAINALSIHLKLISAGLNDHNREQLVEEAREKLVSFLEELEPLVTEAENAKGKPVVGANPRLRQLAKRFVAAKRNRFRYHSILFRETPNRVKQLLSSRDQEDRQLVLDCLEELRMLVEEHVHIDTEQVLGEF
jgi:hypothetical protein